MPDYVVCPAKITSPAPDPNGPFAGMPNLPCDDRVPVVREAPVMEFRCGRGHYFHATPDQVRRA